MKSSDYEVCKLSHAFPNAALAAFSDAYPNLLGWGRGKWARGKAEGGKGKGEVNLIPNFCSNQFTTSGKAWGILHFK